MAIESGQWHCLLCRVGLDYEYSRRPNSAEVDHIQPAALGGQDTLENTRVICRTCNKKLGDETKRVKAQQRKKERSVETVDAEPLLDW